jgi:hypothetical protein
VKPEKTLFFLTLPSLYKTTLTPLVVKVFLSKMFGQAAEEVGTGALLKALSMCSPTRSDNARCTCLVDLAMHLNSPNPYALKVFVVNENISRQTIFKHVCILLTLLFFLFHCGVQLHADRTFSGRGERPYYYSFIFPLVKTNGWCSLCFRDWDRRVESRGRRVARCSFLRL